MKQVIRIEDEELGVDWQDAGPWRSFRLDTEGECLIGLLENASVCAVDQDGGEISTDGLYDCSQEVIDAAEKLIARTFLAAQGLKTIWDDSGHLPPKASCV